VSYEQIRTKPWPKVSKVCEEREAVKSTVSWGELLECSETDDLIQ